jgi:hypothetical protein
VVARSNGHNRELLFDCAGFPLRRIHFFRLVTLRATGLGKAVGVLFSQQDRENMSLTVFTTEMNRIARSAAFVNERNAIPASQILPLFELQKQDIFEQLLLFDSINFKVYGENAVVPLLIQFLGIKGFEELVEQGAFGFTLWTPMLGFMNDNIPGLDTLVHGSHSDPVHCDPLKSVETGLNVLASRLRRSDRRRLTKKLVKLYNVPRTNLPDEVTSLTRSAHRSGKLRQDGMRRPMRPIDDLSLVEKMDLVKYAERLLEYRYLLESDMTSFSSYDFYTYFQDTAEKLRAANTVKENFAELTSVEEFPDLKKLLTELDNPYLQLPKLRARRHAVKFRDWIARASLYQNHSIKENYLSALEEGLGFFKSKTGRLVKTLAVTSMGMAIGHQLGGVGTLMGAGVGAAIEPMTGIVWDQIDEFLLDGLAKGWSPRMFFNDLRAIEKLKA